MKSKILILNLLAILLLANFTVVNAYEFINKENETPVLDRISEIYDSKQQYEDLAGGLEETTPIVTSSNRFWWPIGSRETTTDSNNRVFAKGDPESITITSYFGSKEVGIHDAGHGAIDIGSGGASSGVVNVIASKSGTVVYPVNKSQTQFRDNIGNGLGNGDGGGYGNYIIIEHSDGMYTLYAHLAYNSVTVMAGDVVEQGQVIAKLGHTGNSTGPHLHFEMREGGNTFANRVDPLDYVDPENPRPLSFGSGSDFSITETSLTRDEFIYKMNDYCARSGKQGFCDNFAANAGEIYDASLRSNVNPELVVVTAGGESSWSIIPACRFTNNYWGLGTPNNLSCLQGSRYGSLIEGVIAYGESMADFLAGGKYDAIITERYNLRESAGCDPAGHGLPGTVEGMQSFYSWIGHHRYNPGSPGQGGCYVLDIVYGAGYCNTVPNCTNYTAVESQDNITCPANTRTTVCEQNDYTAWQLKQKRQMRFDIFGL